MSQTGSDQAFSYESEAKELDLDSAPADLGGCYVPAPKGTAMPGAVLRGTAMPRGSCPAHTRG